MASYPGPRDVPPTRPNAPATGWQVTGQQRIFGLDASGRPGPGYSVQFTTGSGAPGEVFIPDARYNPTNVRAAVAAMAAHIDEMQGLRG